MKFDPELTDQEKELIRMWQQSTLPAPVDAEQLARTIAARVEKFDRKILQRNLREYAAGAVVVVCLLVWLALDPGHRPLALAGIAATGFVMAYLWRNQRQTPPLDPAADVRSYHAALLDRYDRQIRLLRHVKYWYVLPIYLWLLLTMVYLPSPLPGGWITSFVFDTLFAGFIVWLNEGYGVRKLRAARKKAELLLEEGE
jgi:hypothetical protein